MSKKKQTPKEETPKNDNALADEVLKTVLSYGNNQDKLKLSDALGALCFAGLEIYFASRFAAQTPGQPAGDDKTAQESSQPSA